MSRNSILSEVWYERESQIAKWGEQPVPSVTARCADLGPECITDYYGLPTEHQAKAWCDEAHAQGRLSSAHIAVEELCEAISCGSNEVAMREELVQVAAVIVHWIECIDRRAATATVDYDPNED